MPTFLARIKCKTDCLRYVYFLYASTQRKAKNACRERSIEAIDGHKLLKYMSKVNVNVPNILTMCPECGSDLIEKGGPYG